MVDVFVLQVDTGELYPVVVGSRSETYVHILRSGVSVVTHTHTHIPRIWRHISMFITRSLSLLSQVKEESNCFLSTSAHPSEALCVNANVCGESVLLDVAIIPQIVWDM